MGRYGTIISICPEMPEGFTDTKVYGNASRYRAFVGRYGTIISICPEMPEGFTGTKVDGNASRQGVFMGRYGTIIRERKKKCSYQNYL
ncbi:MAG: hypothetical protein HFI13_05625 [Lachnospiraceae bacterium]|nr:hypothetical protein [Lachnospiraceae bacterium]